MVKFRQPYFIYLISVSLLGLVLITRGGLQVAQIDQLLNFILLLILAALAEIAATSVRVSEGAGITYHVGPAVALASVPLAGPAAGVIIAAASSLSLWLIKPADKTTWKKSWSQLGFNTGMQCIALFFGGWILLISQNLLNTNGFLEATIPWLLAAVTFDQVNLWLLIGILRLQHGKEINPWHIWRENRWAASIASIAFGVGAGFLAFAIERFDWLGIIIFFMPLILSAYAFRLYVGQMKAHMDNLENIIAERTKKLEKVMKEKDQFLAVLTHDMKTPLTSAKLYATMIRDYPHLAMEKPHMLEIILKSQETLTEMVNNILDIEKLQTGKTMTLVKERLDLASLIETTIEPLNAQASSKNIDLQYHIHTRPMLIDADRGQIKRVLQNLVSNAIKYTPEEGRVSVHAKVNNQTIGIEVSDNGYGIPSAELPYVYDRFQRVAKHKRIAAGTGLGLAITKAIVEAHGGSISVDSEEDKGSTFKVELPI